MQDDVAPPQVRIDWWLGMTAAQREAYMQDVTTSEATQAELRALEAYCLSHRYEVYCRSALRPRPFAPHILQPTESTIETPSDLPGVPHSASPLLWASVTGETGGVRGRRCVHTTECSGDDTTLAAQAAAKSRLLTVVQHVNEYLTRYYTLPDEAATVTDEPAASKVAPHIRRALAGLVVQLLLEAAVAASYRDGTAERLERAQYMAQLRQAKEHAAAAALAARRYRTRNSRSTSMMRDSDDDDDDNEPQAVGAAAATSVMAVRPVAVALRETQALASLWLMLNWSHRTSDVPSCTTVRNGWRALREQAKAALHARALSMQKAEEEEEDKSEDRVNKPKKPSRHIVHITAQDMRFAIEKLLASPPAEALLGECHVGLVVLGRRILRLRPLTS